MTKRDARHFRHGVSAWLGLFVLVSNILAAPVIGKVSTTSLRDSLQTVEALGRLAICTSQGVVNNAPGKPTNPAPIHKNDHEALCIFCLPLSHGATDAPASTALPSPPDMSARTTFVLANRPEPAPAQIRPSSPARAPPTA